MSIVGSGGSAGKGLMTLMRMSLKDGLFEMLILLRMIRRLRVEVFPTVPEWLSKKVPDDESKICESEFELSANTPPLLLLLPGTMKMEKTSKLDRSL